MTIEDMGRIFGCGDYISFENWMISTDKFLDKIGLPSVNLRKKICWRSMAVQKGTQSSLRPEVLKFSLGGIVDECFLCYEQRG